MRQYLFAVALSACASSLALEQRDELDVLDAAATCYTGEDSECSLLQVTLVAKVAADVNGAGSARLGTEEQPPPGAPYPRTPSDAALALAKMATDDDALTPGSALRGGAAAPVNSQGRLALFMERLSAEGLHIRIHPPGRVPDEDLPVVFYAAFLAFLAICFFLANRKQRLDDRGTKAARTVGAPPMPWRAPDLKEAPQSVRRALNLLSGSGRDVEEAASVLARPPEEEVASRPALQKAPENRTSRVRSRSNTRDAGRRGGLEEPKPALRATTLESPGDARSIVGLVVSQVPHAPCEAIRSLRAVREVLTAAGGDHPLRLEKADLLKRGITPQCFELLRAAGLNDVGRGLVLGEAAGPKLLKARTAVDEALQASSSKLAPLPAVQVVTEAYGSYVEEEVFTYN